MSDVPTVHERMAEVVRALSHIPKQSSQGVSYEFRSIDAVMGALHGPLADQGLYLAPRVLDDWQINPIPGTNNRTQYQAAFRVCVDVYAADGSMTTLGPGLAQSHDYGDKAVYQAQQNAIKYLLLEAFCIPTAEQDMDAREADPSPAAQTVGDKIRVAAKQHDLIPQVKQYLMVQHDTDKVDALTADDQQTLLGMLESDAGRDELQAAFTPEAAA